MSLHRSKQWRNCLCTVYITVLLHRDFGILEPESSLNATLDPSKPNLRKYLSLRPIMGKVIVATGQHEARRRTVT